jgi:hypothetical protein
MHKIIDQITDNLAGLVTSDKPFYSPKELLQAKIPSFVVERIRMALEDKVHEELGKLSTDWFDFSSRLVTDAWIDFEQAALGSSHIPRDELYQILSNVVSDIVHVFIEPRKNMASYIFRDDEELSLQEMEHRCSRLTVYKHFGTAIPLYMKKRELDNLDKERCSLLIQKIDAKLVAAYKPEDWAQKLEQLFVLFGGEVDPKLLAIFFEDKGLPAMAKKFSSKRKLITKSDFIYIISAKESDSQKKAGNKAEEQSLVESFFGEYSEDPVQSPLFDDSLAEQFLEGGLSDEEMTDLLYDIASDGVVEVDHEHVASLNELFQSDNDHVEDSISETSEEIAAKIKDQKEDDPEEIKEFRENLISILDQAKHSFEDITGEEESSKPTDQEQPTLSIQLDEEELVDENEIIEEGKDDSKQPDESENEQDDDQPIWTQFISSDQMDVVMGGKRSEERMANPELSSEDEDTDIEVSDDYDDEIFEESSSVSKENESIVAELKDILNDRKPEFLEVIFKSTEREFESALVKLSEFTSWQEASNYIKNEIFTKNDVDLFSGATVDFTDRMHRYFNEQTHS